MEPVENGEVEDAAGWRGSRDLWLEAAHDVLLDSGVESVKILPLAKKLGLSRASFYWFFKDREELLDALIEHWSNKNTSSIVKQAEAYAESIVEAMLNVFDCWVDSRLFDSKFEFAVRSWALQSDAILERIRNADAVRLKALREMLMRFGCNPVMADVRANAAYLIQIGYISMQIEEPMEVRMSRLPAYLEIYTGQAPRANEMARFYARHGHKPAKAGVKKA